MMKVHKLEVIIVDHDGIGAESAKLVIENANYPNDCIMPSVLSIETRDIGEWTDDNPLNFSGDIERAEIERLFRKVS